MRLREKGRLKPKVLAFAIVLPPLCITFNLTGESFCKTCQQPSAMLLTENTCTSTTLLRIAMTVQKDSASFCLIGSLQSPKKRVARRLRWIPGYSGLVPIDSTLPIGWTLSLIISVCVFDSFLEERCLQRPVEFGHFPMTAERSNRMGFAR